MTPLRAKYIRGLAIRGRAVRTQQAYTSFVVDLAKYYRRSPDQISYEEVTIWIEHLIKERHLAPSSVNIAVNAVRFLYGTTLGRDTAALLAGIPRMKRNTRRAEVYAKSELEVILTAPAQPRDRAFLMTVYACGLRLSEATHLRTTDIDRARMQLRVRQGKGAKERVLPLSQRLLGHSSLLTTARYLQVTAARLGQIQSPLDLIELAPLSAPTATSVSTAVAPPTVS